MNPGVSVTSGGPLKPNLKSVSDDVFAVEVLEALVPVEESKK
jgi:hypothetical protein